jgi:hypothetical protein
MTLRSWLSRGRDLPESSRDGGGGPVVGAAVLPIYPTGYTLGSASVRIAEGVIRMDDDYSQMTRQELLSARKRLADELEDFEEMTAFHSINSPTHATMTERKATGLRLERMRDAIAEIEGLLAAATSE